MTRGFRPTENRCNIITVLLVQRNGFVLCLLLLCPTPSPGDGFRRWARRPICLYDVRRCSNLYRGCSDHAACRNLAGFDLISGCRPSGLLKILKQLLIVGELGSRAKERLIEFFNTPPGQPYRTTWTPQAGVWEEEGRQNDYKPLPKRQLVSLL